MGTVFYRRGARGTTPSTKMRTQILKTIRQISGNQRTRIETERICLTFKLR